MLTGFVVSCVLGPVFGDITLWKKKLLTISPSSFSCCLPALFKTNCRFGCFENLSKGAYISYLRSLKLVSSVDMFVIDWDGSGMHTKSLAT